MNMEKVDVTVHVRTHFTNKIRYFEYAMQIIH